MRQHPPRLAAWLEKRPLKHCTCTPNGPDCWRCVSWLSRILARASTCAGGLAGRAQQIHRSLSQRAGRTVRFGIAARCRGYRQIRYQPVCSPLRISRKAHTLRFRVLDPAIPTIPGSVCADVTLDADSFSRLELPVKHVFITENETNFLAFPQVPHAIVIFGAGYGWDALARSHWLKSCSMHYWGDIDTHGFGILDQLRSYFVHVESFLMDRATLDAHSNVWGTEAQAAVGGLAQADQRRTNSLRRSARQPHPRRAAAGARTHWLSLAGPPPATTAAWQQRCQAIILAMSLSKRPNSIVAKFRITIVHCSPQAKTVLQDLASYEKNAGNLGLAENPCIGQAGRGRWQDQTRSRRRCSTRRQAPTD